MPTKRYLMQKEDGTLFIRVEEVMADDRSLIITGRQKGKLLFEDPRIYKDEEHYNQKYGSEKDEYLEDLKRKYKEEMYAKTSKTFHKNLGEELDDTDKEGKRIGEEDSGVVVGRKFMSDEKIKELRTKEEDRMNIALNSYKNAQISKEMIMNRSKKMNPLQRAVAKIKIVWNKNFGPKVKKESPNKHAIIEQSVARIVLKISKDPIFNSDLQKEFIKKEINQLEATTQSLSSKIKGPAYNSFMSALSKLAAVFSLGKKKEADLSPKTSMTFMGPVPKAPTLEEAKAQQKPYRTLKLAKMGDLHPSRLEENKKSEKFKPSLESIRENEPSTRPRRQSLTDIRNPASSEIETKENQDNKPPKGPPRRNSFSS
jgi:hypothetical protein